MSVEPEEEEEVDELEKLAEQGRLMIAALGRYSPSNDEEILNGVEELLKDIGHDS